MWSYLLSVEAKLARVVALAGNEIVDGTDTFRQPLVIGGKRRRIINQGRVGRRRSQRP